MQIYLRGIYYYKEQGFTLSGSTQCRAFSRAVMAEKSLSPLFHEGGVGAGEGDTGYKWLVY